MPEANPHHVPISEVMTHAAVTVAGDATVESLFGLMTSRHVGCIPVVDRNGRPIGIVTKHDLIECREATRTTARDVMMPFAMALKLTDTLADASTLMSREGFHHVLVVEGERIAGIVSTFDVTSWVARLSAPRS